MTPPKFTSRLTFLIIILFAALYCINISGWLLHDDEGTDLYEAWRFSLGEQPGEDFAAAQQPLFLLAGGAAIDLFGREVAPLRLLSAVQVLLGAVILLTAVSRIWNRRVGLFTFIFVLSSGMVYELARLYRPDPMMLAWELIGLSAVLLAVRRADRRYWMLGGAAYGISVLWKPFGVLPVAGIAFYFAYAWQRQRAERLSLVGDGVLFFGSFVLAAGGAIPAVLCPPWFLLWVRISAAPSVGDRDGFPVAVRAGKRDAGAFSFLASILWDGSEIG